MADKKESKTVWITLDTTLYYAQVFEQNRDKGEVHSETDGVTKVTLALTDEQINELKSLGVPESALGYQTFKDFDIDGVQFRGYVAKRPWVSKYLKDDNGEPQVMGAPKVFDFNKAVAAWKEAGGTGRIMDEHITPWDMEKDGLIGNGSKAKVKLSIYRGKNKAGKPTCVVTLEAVAITEHVPYEGGNRNPDEVVF
jgi:hypothetical protein